MSMLASEIMTPQPYMIPSSMDVMEAADFYVSHSITTAPVQNPLGEILGMLSEVDLLKAVVQFKTNPKSGQSKVIHAQEWFDAVVFVNEADGASEVVKAMIKSRNHRVLVRDKSKRVIGIISPKDLMRHLVGDRKGSKPIADELQQLHAEIEQLRGKLSEMSMYLETYDTVFQSGLYMLHSADREGKIVMANERLHRVLEYEPGALIGKTIFDIYHPSVHAEARAGLKKVMAEGKHHLTFSLMVKRSGEALKIDVASSALRDEVGRFLGTFTISRPYQENPDSLNELQRVVTGAKASGQKSKA